MNSGFYGKNIDFAYPEIAICLEDTIGPMAKIFVPIATPTLPHSVAYDNKGFKLYMDNIISDTTTLFVQPCTESNYIELRLPDDKGAKKDDKFIIVFIGGDVNKPTLIGRYNE